MRARGFPMLPPLAAIASLLVPPALAQSVTYCVNAPVTLGGTPYQWNQTIDASFGAPPAYALRFDGGANGLAPDVHLDALALLSGDRFLFSTESPFTAGATDYAPGDVVRYEGGGAYSMYLAAAALGLDPEVNVDAVAFDPAGRALLSFDAPVTLGNLTIQPNDVAVVDNGALSVFVSGAGLGVPEDVNVTGFELAPGGVQLFQFDVPVELGGQSFLPSDVAAWNGTAWSVYFTDPAFPPDVAGSDFALPCAGAGYTGALAAAKLGGATEISWTAGGAVRYDLVRGDLGVLRATAGNFTQALDAIVPAADVCLLNDSTAVSTTDTRPDPAAGQGYFYLVRAVSGCGAGGTFDAGASQVGSRDAEIAAAAGSCP